jgi:hypothetical protein
LRVKNKLIGSFDTKRNHNRLSCLRYRNKKYSKDI